MLQEITCLDIKAKPDPGRGIWPRSSEEDGSDISEELDRLFSSLMDLKLDFPYQKLTPVSQVDTSSLKSPHIKTNNETYLTEELSEEEIINSLIEHDPIVLMPPVKEYSVRLKIVSVDKAVPRVVEPEGI